MDMWPSLREGEKVVPYGTPVEFLEGGNLIGMKKSAYGIGSAQVLIVVVIDGYGGREPVDWTAYGLPEFQVEGLLDSSFLNIGSGNYEAAYVRRNTFSRVRDYGNRLFEEDARELFPFLEDLPYDL